MRPVAVEERELTLVGPQTAIGALESLHRSAIREPRAIELILAQLVRERIPLRRGVNERIEAELAYAQSAAGEVLHLDTRDLSVTVTERVLLNFKLARDAYAMVVEVTESGAERIVVAKPQVIYRAERRDRQRERPGPRRCPGDRVRLAYGDKTLGYGRLTDISPDGLGVDVPAEVSLSGHASIVVHFLEGDQKGQATTVELRHERESEGSGWKRIGLSKLRDGQALLQVDRRTRLHESRWSSAQTRWSMFGAGLRTARKRALPTILSATSQSVPVRIVDYTNTAGQRLRAIVDACGDTRGAPAVIIPPAWGRTKETLLPLAATIVSSFRASRQPVVVVRFDGIRRRGESFNEPSCRTPGSEYHQFTFSQAVDDILTTADFLNSDPAFQPRSLVVVTFSAASIDGRRAVAVGADRGLSGWISVVGSADLQSMMRVVSGGVDFVSGVERGLSFGLNNILGVEVDIDLAGRDAIQSRLAFLEDSCRDFETIHVPVTWFHGKYDAWMDLERVRVALSSGERSNRKLIEIPTGHQLRSSKEALAVFQLVAAEAGRMIADTAVKPCLPDLDELDRRRRAEKARLPAKGTTDRRAFWKSYLLGRDGSLGIELMTGTSAYHGFMRTQIDLLRLTSGERVLDLAAGTGSFPLQVAEGTMAASLRIVGVDYVKESLRRAQVRLATRSRSGLDTEFAVCDLDVGARYSVPMRDQSFDAALASLLLGYLESPLEFFKEVARVLRPGGRFVTSGLRKDADVSRIFRDGLAELESGVAVAHFDPSEIRDLPRASRDFLSEAARLFDLEEEGVFEFLDPDDAISMLRDAGFEEVSLHTAFGDPPQAVVLGAIKGRG